VSGTLPVNGRLAHLGRLTVDPSLLERRFAAGCATRRCDGSCCFGGVSLDVIERDRVLAHADLVRRVMTRGQDTDPAHWFQPQERVDPDFPSGRATHTGVGAKGCVFLDGNRRCSLQKASLAAGNGLDLKPFLCRWFPIMVSGGILLVDDDADDLGRTQCCGAKAGGPLTIFEVCATELEHALGADGVVSLRRLAEAAEGAAREG
jgi:Fe-S-cluster containining protein